MQKTKVTKEEYIFYIYILLFIKILHKRTILKEIQEISQNQNQIS